MNAASFFLFFPSLAPLSFKQPHFPLLSTDIKWREEMTLHDKKKSITKLLITSHLTAAHYTPPPPPF